MLCRLLITFLTVVACTLCAVQAAEKFDVAPLTPDESAAMATIEQSEVLATVSFLASDEMAGRNTPSVQLDIAAAYVASRFRGAGLEGPGPDGSYFQTSELTQFAAPAGEPTLITNNQPVASRGILWGSEQECNITATTTDGKNIDEVSGRIVVIDDVPLPPQAVDNLPALIAALSRRVTPLTNKGAVAILVRTAEDSLLPEAAARLKQTPIMLPPQFLITCPVILIASDTALEGEVTVKAPPREVVKTPVRNVIGILRGSDPELAKQAILVSAHLDHIGVLSGDRQGDVINNGADDNATGVTAVVSLADAFARLKQRPKRSLIFMTFWGEEKGLLGSKYYADHPLWPLEQTVANINFEMLGRPEINAEGKAWGTGWTRSDLGSLIAAGAARAGVEVFHREDVSEMLYARSDNYAFVEKGVIAHSFSAGSLHSDYHQPSDEVRKLNLPHMTQIIKGLFAGILPLAEGQFTPQKRGP